MYACGRWPAANSVMSGKEKDGIAVLHSHSFAAYCIFADSSHGTVALLHSAEGVQLLLLRVFILGAGYICFVAICLCRLTSHLFEVIIRNRCGNDRIQQQDCHAALTFVRYARNDTFFCLREERF